MRSKGETEAQQNKGWWVSIELSGLDPNSQDESYGSEPEVEDNIKASPNGCLFIFHFSFDRVTSTRIFQQVL